MKRLLCLLFLFYPLGVFGQVSDFVFIVEPDSIDLGDGATLSWNFAGAHGAYITGVGVVPPSGTRQVSPRYTTSYSLIVEAADAIRSKTVTLKVKSKGSDVEDPEFPEIGKFREGRIYRLTADSLTGLLGHIHDVLQDTLGFTLDESLIELSGGVAFRTKPLQDDMVLLQTKRQPGVRYRSVSILLELNDTPVAPGTYAYSIKALIQIKRRAVRTWRAVGDGVLYREAIEKVRDVLSASRE